MVWPCAENGLGKMAGKAMAEALKANKTLLDLDLRGKQGVGNEGGVWHEGADEHDPACARRARAGLHGASRGTGIV